MPSPRTQPKYANVSTAKVQRTRRSILAAAGEEFAERGYTATSVSSIARRAHLSVGAVYLYFTSKRELALWHVDESFRELADLIGAIDRNQPIGDWLREAGQAYLRHAVADPAAHRLAVMSTLDLELEPHCEIAREAVSEQIRLIMEDIHAVVAPAFDGDFDRAAPLVAHIWASWTGIANLMLRGDGHEVMPEIGYDALGFGAALLDRVFAPPGLDMSVSERHAA